jgi:hypothetical protein
MPRPSPHYKSGQRFPPRHRLGNDATGAPGWCHWHASRDMVSSTTAKQWPWRLVERAPNKVDQHADQSESYPDPTKEESQPRWRPRSLWFEAAVRGQLVLRPLIRIGP